jgi:sucrose phosphorylase
MMQSSVVKLLFFLYGEATAHTILPRVQQLITKYPKPNLQAQALSERDALLITYGDQVRAVDERPLQTLARFLDAHLDGVISGVHILPFYPYSSDDGFSVIDYLAIDSALGTWDDVARLRRHFDLMFDAVINHISAQSEWFKGFLRDDPLYRDYFITVEGASDLSRVVRPRTLPLLTEFKTPSGSKKVWTTFSADQIDLNYRSPEVLLAMLDALLFYVSHGARFIRLDAIAFLWKELGTTCIHLPQTHAIIQLIRAVLNSVAPPTQLITETNVPHADNLSYFGDGANEAQLVYNFALPPLVLHAFHMGRATTLARWAEALALPSDHVTFFNFLASHDGIGLNPARGILSESEIDMLVARTAAHGGLVSYKNNPDGSQSPYELNINYFDALSNPKADESLETQINRFLCAQAIMLALQGVPGIYFHSLFGSRNDRAGADASGIPRRINRPKFTRAELEHELAEPASLRAQVFTRYAELLRVRRAHHAFHPHGAQHVVPCDERVFALERIAPDGSERVLCLHNVSPETVSVEVATPLQRKQWVNLASWQAVAAASGVLKLALQPYRSAWLVGA